MFSVLGGQALAAGLLTIYLAQTTFRRRERGAWLMAALSGAGSMAGMALVIFGPRLLACTASNALGPSPG